MVYRNQKAVAFTEPGYPAIIQSAKRLTRRAARDDWELNRRPSQPVARAENAKMVEISDRWLASSVFFKLGIFDIEPRIVDAESMDIRPKLDAMCRRRPNWPIQDSTLLPKLYSSLSPIPPDTDQPKLVTELLLPPITSYLQNCSKKYSLIASLPPKPKLWMHEKKPRRFSVGFVELRDQSLSRSLDEFGSQQRNLEEKRRDMEEKIKWVLPHIPIETKGLSLTSASFQLYMSLWTHGHGEWFHSVLAVAENLESLTSHDMLLKPLNPRCLVKMRLSSFTNGTRRLSCS
ncbi:hypothetical protein C8J56DRAFT_898742 [Mycena floridula]|nr:hypothetical protein C8J56DRAFT_898742 [Mycena floridula]